MPRLSTIGSLINAVATSNALDIQPDVINLTAEEAVANTNAQIPADQLDALVAEALVIVNTPTA